MTHERNVLVWLAARVGWRQLGFVILIILFTTAITGLCGCGLFKSPTAPDDEELHPNEILITEHTQCYADYFRIGKTTCSFFEDERLLDCSDTWGNDENGDPFMCPIIGGAYPGSRHAEYYGPWVRGEPPYQPTSAHLEETAAHEVCHMIGGWNERATRKCAEIAWNQAQCHEGGFQPVGLDPRFIL